MTEAGERAWRLSDGEWHRLHPATPLLRGGIIFIALLGWVVVQFRDLWINIFLGSVVGEEPPEDPATSWILAHSWLAVLIAVGVLVLILGFGWLSWRMHEYRVTDELIEEREGIIWRRHRRGRLDRVQGVDIARPILPRIFGAARLEISMAGSDGSIRLSYVASRIADTLRAEILIAAAYRRSEEAAQQRPAAAAQPGVVPAPLASRAPAIANRVNAVVADFMAPELDQEVAPESVVEMHAGRLVGSTALRLAPVLLIVIAGAVAAGIWRPFTLIFLLPILIAIFGLAGREVLRALRYSIAATPDGIRIGYGLFSTANDTLPPGRIHAIEIRQPLLWRPFGWWRVRINKASSSAREGGSGLSSSTMLPVGTLDEVLRVLGLVLPDWAEPTAFTGTPPRGRWLRWFSWRRNGFAFDDRTVVIRRGALWRTLTLVPLARVQSVAIEDGPLTRAMGLARIEVHTVYGVVSAHIGALDAGDAAAMWRDTERLTLAALT